MVGAGTVGLAIAGLLAKSGCSALFLDKQGSIIQGISFLNSEVIYDDIYYSAKFKRLRC